MTEQDLQICIKAYREGQITDAEMLSVFHKLAERVADHFKKYPWFPANHQDIINDAAKICLDRLPRLGDGRAMGYFVTILSCYIRQAGRSRITFKS